MAAESRCNMQADNPQEAERQPQQGKTHQAANVQATTLNHPKLPADATLIEKIALPFVFSLVTATIKNPAHAAELQEYMSALRDALNEAYPEE